MVKVQNKNRAGFWKIGKSPPQEFCHLLPLLSTLLHFLLFEWMVPPTGPTKRQNNEGQDNHLPFLAHCVCWARLIATRLHCQVFINWLLPHWLLSAVGAVLVRYGSWHLCNVHFQILLLSHFSKLQLSHNFDTVFIYECDTYDHKQQEEERQPDGQTCPRADRQSCHGAVSTQKSIIGHDLRVWETHSVGLYPYQDVHFFLNARALSSMKHKVERESSLTERARQRVGHTWRLRTFLFKTSHTHSDTLPFRQKSWSCVGKSWNREISCQSPVFKKRLDQKIFHSLLDCPVWPSEIA